MFVGGGTNLVGSCPHILPWPRAGI